MSGEDSRLPGPIERLKKYIETLRGHKNFMKSLFMKSFFGKYRETHLGVLWHFVSPMITLSLLIVITLEIRERDFDFVILLASGVFIYHILVSGVTKGTGHFLRGSNMIKKMYFPREILVYVQISIELVVALICYAILFIIIGIIGFGVNWRAMVWFLPIVLMACLTAIGFSLALSSITVYLRDLQYALTSTSIIFFVLTPLRDSIYNYHGLRGELMWYNPFSYFIEPLHQIFYDKVEPELWMIEVCIAITVVSLLIGYLVFSKLKHGFVERL